MQIILEEISGKIYTIRGVQVMLDRDLAELYQVETKIGVNHDFETFLSIILNLFIFPFIKKLR